MNEFNYPTIQKYEYGLMAIDTIGVDFEADRESLTIVTDELSSEEYQYMLDTTK